MAEREGEGNNGDTEQSGNKSGNVSKLSYINNYSKCKWNELGNQKAQSGWMD